MRSGPHWAWRDPPEAARPTAVSGMAAADLTEVTLAALTRERHRAHHALDAAAELTVELCDRVPQGEIR